ncbi:MAG UNVERIFIED_CONTAM: hypothetical protein LVR29_00055 [Microcystis novacekii LVE1205-3]
MAQEAIAFHSKAFPNLTAKKLENYGFVNYRPGRIPHEFPRNGESTP